MENEIINYSEILNSILKYVVKREFEPYKIIEIEFHSINGANHMSDKLDFDTLDSKNNSSTVKDDISIVSNECILFCAVNALFLALCSASIPIKDCFFSSSSFNLEEECFIYAGNKIIYKFGFGEIKKEHEEEANKNLEEIKEYLHYELSKLFIKDN